MSSARERDGTKQTVCRPGARGVDQQSRVWGVDRSLRVGERVPEDEPTRPWGEPSRYVDELRR